MIHCFFVFRRGRDKSRLGLRNWIKKRLGQKCLTPRNKKKLTKIAFQILWISAYFSELLLLPPFIRF
ncbi:hypothetical protein EGW35_11560 [Enterococcus durans]|nr:hypothetical protein F6Y12_07220 [Enterococcus durans]TKN20151.1 hypothetical protein DVW83_02450 [Enterococcus sp. VV15]KAA9193313.1 hypothetical protein F6X88_07375 [Enterococcus durans]KAA9198936.1 hypothetical protein F6X91_07345 [Enterococcus durans]KAA9208247.1 hypothetical protein F6X94_08695 [Enterococcus durans]